MVNEIEIIENSFNNIEKINSNSDKEILDAINNVIEKIYIYVDESKFKIKILSRTSTKISIAECKCKIFFKENQIFFNLL